jgi:hypothetical protein
MTLEGERARPLTVVEQHVPVVRAGEEAGAAALVGEPAWVLWVDAERHWSGS